MGCGASSIPKPVTAEMCEQMCKDAAKDMEIICVNATFAAPDKIKIAPPPCVQEMRENVKKMRAQADEYEKNGKAAAAAPAPVADAGGMAGMLGKMSAVADKVQDAAGAAASTVAGKGLGVLADALDKAVAAVEAPFDTIGKDVCTASKDEMVKVFVDFINKYGFPEAMKVVRGQNAGGIEMKAPYGDKEYNAVAGDSISKSLIGLAETEILALLSPITTKAVLAHDVTSTWTTAIQAYNATFDALAPLVDMEKAQIGRITASLEDQTTKAIYTKIGEMMMETEKATRLNSAGQKVPKPLVFAKIFSGTPLTILDYADWKPNDGTTK